MNCRCSKELPEKEFDPGDGKSQLFPFLSLVFGVRDAKWDLGEICTPKFQRAIQFGPDPQVTEIKRSLCSDDASILFCEALYVPVLGILACPIEISFEQLINLTAGLRTSLVLGTPDMV